VQLGAAELLRAMTHNWFIFWDDDKRRAGIRCACGEQFDTLPAWQRHAKRVKVQ
jgi:hypothetical protein